MVSSVSLRGLQLKPLLGVVIGTFILRNRLLLRVIGFSLVVIADGRGLELLLIIIMVTSDE